MKKLILLLFAYGIILSNAMAQGGAGTAKPAKAGNCSIQDYKGKTYIFDSNVQVFECDGVGANIAGSATIVYVGSLFKVVHVDSVTCDITIKFNTWKAPAKQKIYNFSGEMYLDPTTGVIKSTGTGTNDTVTEKPEINDKNIRYFLLKKADLSNMSEYTKGSKWDISFGTFTNPFKFRPTKSIFTNNLNLGSSVYFLYKYSTNWSLGAVAGLSLSSVTLDSLSTGGIVKTNTDRPALTPSLNFVIAYKSINFTVGPGVDYINKTSATEKSWIFNGKPWIGFGIGINLFNSSSNATPTTKAADQKN